MKHNTFLLIILILITHQILGQNITKTLKAKYITSNIQLDGHLDDAEWQSVEQGKDFVQYFPTDSLSAEYQTNFKILYNESTLYVGIKAYAPNKHYVISSLNRDFRGDVNDNINIIFDTLIASVS